MKKNVFSIFSFFLICFTFSANAALPKVIGNRITLENNSGKNDTVCIHDIEVVLSGNELNYTMVHLFDGEKTKSKKIKSSTHLIRKALYDANWGFYNISEHSLLNKDHAIGLPSYKGNDGHLMIKCKSGEKYSISRSCRFQFAGIINETPIINIGRESSSKTRKKAKQVPEKKKEVDMEYLVKQIEMFFINYNLTQAEKQELLSIEKMDLLEFEKRLLNILVKNNQGLQMIVKQNSARYRSHSPFLKNKIYKRDIYQALNIKPYSVLKYIFPNININDLKLNHRINQLNDLGFENNLANLDYSNFIYSHSNSLDLSDFKLRTFSYNYSYPSTSSSTYTNSFKSVPRSSGISNVIKMATFLGSRGRVRLK